ncbi:MAG TPA: OmpA family protein [Polyangiaceae bacterium]|nr:OmpA family protein [Polyangiaceae bacterium]
MRPARWTRVAARVVSPVLAGILVLACGGSQKQANTPEQRAAEAQDNAHNAAQQAAQARDDVKKAQDKLTSAQQAAAEAEANAMQASQEAQQAEQQAAGSLPPPQPNTGRQQSTSGGRQPNTGPTTGVTSRQGEAGGPQTIAVVTFATNSADLSPAARRELDHAAAAIHVQGQNSRVAVDGYTDATGNDAANKKLSEERARAVADYLASKGVPKGSITAQGMGPSGTATSDNTPQSRTMDRRADVIVQPQPGHQNGATMQQPR